MKKSPPKSVWPQTKKQDKISSQVSDKEVVNRSQVQESTQIIMLLCVSFSNKLGNSMPLGPLKRISWLENNKISSKVGINEQEELINGQEENRRRMFQSCKQRLARYLMGFIGSEK